MAGDEMAVRARHMRSAEGAAAVARQLIAAVAVPWRSPEGFAVVAGVSVGICMYPEHAASGQALLQGAHSAVYGAKAQGRGAWCFFQEGMTQAARERLGLEARLRRAMQQYEASVIEARLRHFQGNRMLVAESLNIPKRTLDHKCQKLEVN